MEAKALVDKLSDTLSEVMAKTIADTLTCVDAKDRSKQKLTLLQERRLTRVSTH